MCKIQVLRFPETRDLEFFLNLLQKKRGHGDKNQVIKSDDQKDLGISKGPGGDDFAFTGQLYTCNDIGQRGIFDQIDDLVAAAGQGPSKCLRHDDIAHGFKSGKSHGLCGQELSFLDGQKTATNILGMVSAAAQYKTGNGRCVGVQIDAEIGQSEIEQKKLYQKGRSPKNHGISIGYLSNDRVAECTQCSDCDSETEAEESGWNDQFYGHDQSPVQGRNQLG